MIALLLVVVAVAVLAARRRIKKAARPATGLDVLTAAELHASVIGDHRRAGFPPKRAAR